MIRTRARRHGDVVEPCATAHLMARSAPRRSTGQSLRGRPGIPAPIELGQVVAGRKLRW